MRRVRSGTGGIRGALETKGFGASRMIIMLIGKTGRWTEEIFGVEEVIWLTRGWVSRIR